MNNLLLSSQRLGANKILQTGELNITELLEKQGKEELVQLKNTLPKKALTLQWKEVKTPETAPSFRDLAGKKLAEYQFQYLGQFYYGGQLISATSEIFEASFPGQNINNTSVESTGWLNCTWLIDFLMNADAIQKDSLRQEFLIWTQEGKKASISLSAQASDKRSAEQQKFVFDNNFKTITWEHHTLFGQ